MSCWFQIYSILQYVVVNIADLYIETQTRIIMSIVDIHHRKLLCVYCPGHAEVKGNDRADRLAGKATLTSGLLLGRSEVLRSSGHYPVYNYVVVI